MLELHLLPLRNEIQLNERRVHCYERLIMPYDVEIFCQLVEIDPADLPEGMDLPKKPTIVSHPIRAEQFIVVPGYGDPAGRRVDPLGNEFAYLFANEFCRIKMPARPGYRNVAVMRYVTGLEDRTPIILWWC